MHTDKHYPYLHEIRPWEDTTSISMQLSLPALCGVIQHVCPRIMMAWNKKLVEISEDNEASAVHTTI